METSLLGGRRDVCFSRGINDAAGAECATVHPVGGHLPRVRRYKLVYWYSVGGQLGGKVCMHYWLRTVR